MMSKPSGSAVHRAFLPLLFSLLISSPNFAQDGGRFLRWTYQDATHLLGHRMPTVLLLGAAGAGFVAAGAQVDEDVLHDTQASFSGEEIYLDVTNELGNPIVLAAPAALFGIALAGKDAHLQDAAFTSVQAVLYAGTITRIVKEVAGRHRPEEGNGASEFEPFSGNSSVPSGHATIAFALLTPWAYYYPHPATYGLLALGIGTAVSRIALDRHWPTDVVAGGAIGFLMARYLSKRHLSQAENHASLSVSPLLGRFAGIRLSVQLSSP